MKVQHSIVNNNKLNTVPVVDGQVVYVKDTHDLYFDVNNTRTKATDIIFVDTLQERDAIQSPTPNKVYCVEEDNKFYRYENNEWVLVGGEEVTPQVFYWDGNQQQAGLDFWTNIYKIQKTTPCIVVHTEKIFNAGVQYKTFVWHYYNNLPTGGATTTYSNVGSWDFNQYGTSSGFNVYTVVRASLYFKITNDVVTTIYYSTEVQDINYLDTQKNVAGNYVPQYNNSPANKKYVDDSFDNYVPMRAFPQGVDITHTTTVFLNSIKALNLNTGDMLLGTVHLTDMPDGIVTGAEVKIEVYDNNVIYATMTSSNVAPYVWTCNSHSFRGWEAAYRATEAVFDNTGTDLSSTNVEDAIVELNTKIGSLNTLIEEINGE